MIVLLFSYITFKISLLKELISKRDISICDQTVECRYGATEVFELYVHIKYNIGPVNQIKIMNLRNILNFFNNRINNDTKYCDNNKYV